MWSYDVDMNLKLSNQDMINTLDIRRKFFHDIIKTSSLYLNKSSNLMNGINVEEEKLDKQFTRITSYFNYDIRKLKLKNDSKETVKSYLNSLINLHMHIKKRPSYETKKRIEECKTSKKEVLNMINSQDLIFNI